MPATAVDHPYDVHVCRTGYGHRTIRVQAPTPAEASARALEQAPNEVFAEQDAEYTAEGVLPVSEDPPAGG